MKTLILLIWISALSLNIIFAQEKIDIDPSFPPLEDRYLGQKPPGLTPEIFALGIVSTEEHIEGYYKFTPDMKEFYFSRRGGKNKKPISGLVIKYENNSWGEPSVLPNHIDEYRERFNPDRSKHSEVIKKAPFKDIPIWGGVLSSTGTCYFYVLEAGGSGYMGYSRLINGKYETPQKLNKSINGGIYTAHPFIAPDESYLMWDAQKEGIPGADIYISFRQKDGSWGEAISMKGINTAKVEQGASLTPDGKYLFFYRGEEKFREDGSRYWFGSPHWVDSQIIETFRPKK